MTTDIPDVKRRRLNSNTSANAALTLSKPFKSPLKSNPAAINTPPGASSTPSNKPQQKSRSTPNPNLPKDEDEDSKNPPTTCGSQEEPQASIAPKSTHTPRALPRLNAHTTSTSAAQHSRARDATLITTLRAEIDTLTQATRLLASADPDDRDLRALIARWRRAGQAAAEEVYGVTKDRVNRMGGVAGLREQEKRAEERKGEWQARDEEEEAKRRQEEEAEDEDEDSEEEGVDVEVREARRVARDAAKERRREQIEEAKAEAEAESGYDAAVKREVEAEKQKKGWGGEGRDDDAFTMDMMLRKLNIELDVIGFDAVEQRWMD